MDPTQHPLLTPTEVADLFGVHVETVIRWGKKGVLSSIRTPGGRRRFCRKDFVYALEPPQEPPLSRRWGHLAPCAQANPPGLPRWVHGQPPHLLSGVSCPPGGRVRRK